MSRPRLVLAAAVLLLVGVGAALVGVATWPRAAVPPSAAVASPASLPAADAAFFRELAPRLRAATEQARELAALGETRSRNLLEIRAAQSRMAERLAEVDALVAAGPPPARFASVLAAYDDGATAVRRAMTEAEAGFLRLDWDRVAEATTVIQRGALELERAVARLAAVAGATPAAASA